MDAAALADEWTIVPTIAFLRTEKSTLFWPTIVRPPPTAPTRRVEAIEIDKITQSSSADRAESLGL